MSRQPYFDVNRPSARGRPAWNEVACEHTVHSKKHFRPDTTNNLSIHRQYPENRSVRLCSVCADSTGLRQPIAGSRSLTAGRRQLLTISFALGLTLSF